MRSSWWWIVLFVPVCLLAKTPIHGLVSMGSLGFNNAPGKLPNNSMEEINAHPGIYTGAVINLLWSQLEPQRGVFDDSALTSALAAIAAYNAKYPSTPVVGKLRISMGIGTPAWVMQLTGGPIAVSNGSGTIQVGAFWTSAYRTEWQALQAHLASEFDTSAMIGEVAISSCSSRTDEPFIISLDATSLTNMRQFGFNDAAYMACLSGAKDDYAAWVNTPLDYTFNEYRNSDGCTTAQSTNCLVGNSAFPIQVMDAFRAALGTGRGVVANHGLQNPLAAGALPIYAEFQNLYNQSAASPLEFQTYSQSVDWDSTIALGLTYHPTEIEIWDTVAAGGLANLSTAQLQSYAAGLKASGASSGARLVSAASLLGGSVAEASLVSIFGTALSTTAGVTVTDSSGVAQQAVTTYVSNTQINAVLPANLANGAAMFTNGSVTGTFGVAPVVPGIFTANSGGTGVAAAETLTVHADGSSSGDVVFTCSTAAACTAKPIHVGTPGDIVYLVLFGTGFRNRSSLPNTSVVFGTTAVAPLYAGAQGVFPGLDQINVAIPTSLAGAGTVNLTFSADGAVSNTVTISIQ